MLVYLATWSSLMYALLAYLPAKQRLISCTQLCALVDCNRGQTLQILKL